MSAPFLFVQLDNPPNTVTRMIGDPCECLIDYLSLPYGVRQIVTIQEGFHFPCTKHRPVIIVSGVWDFKIFYKLPSRVFLWLQEAKRNKCPIFGFGFAHLVLNSAFGGLNGKPSYPGLTSVYKRSGAEDVLTSGLPERFTSWSVCTQNASVLPFATETLACTEQSAPMLVRFDARTYSTPLSLSLSWSAMTIWLLQHPEFLAGNESLLDNQLGTGDSLWLLEHFLKVWGPPSYQEGRTHNYHRVQ